MKPSATKNLFDVLGVSRDVSDAGLQRAYRQLARELHPDVTGPNPAKTERFKEVCAAYAILKDVEKRRMYVAELDGAQNKSEGNVMSSIFGAEFEDLVSRVQTEGIGVRNLDSLLSQLFSVAEGVQRRAPETIKKVSDEAAKSPGSLLDVMEGLLDTKLAWDAKRKTK